MRTGPYAMHQRKWICIGICCGISPKWAGNKNRNLPSRKYSQMVGRVLCTAATFSALITDRWFRCYDVHMHTLTRTRTHSQSNYSGSSVFFFRFPDVSRYESFSRCFRPMCNRSSNVTIWIIRMFTERLDGAANGMCWLRANLRFHFCHSHICRLQREFAPQNRSK